MDIRNSTPILSVAIAAALFSCSAFAQPADKTTPERESTTLTPETNPDRPMTNERDRNDAKMDRKADNTGINERDRNDATTLPTDQPNNSADLEVAAAVRAAIVEDDSLSVTAQNVKLVAAGGVVVLRGPVANAAEKAKVAEIAGAVSGVSKVENRLEVTAP